MGRRKAFERETVRKPVLAASGACGKVAYHDRKQARKATKLAPGERLRPYRCSTCSLWHIGHLPSAVRRGHASTREWYSGKPSEVQP